MPEEEKIVSYPISQTGGRGYNFEDSVATHFLLAMIAGAELWGAEYGHITKIDWQTHADGWLFDDLLLTLKDRTGILHRVAISIKSSAQINSHGFPQEITRKIWTQFIDASSPFDSNRDLLLFVVGEIGEGILSAWTDIQREVSSADDERISNRLAADGAWSKDKKEIFNSLACSDEKYKNASLSICTIIRRLYVKSFDFLNKTSLADSEIRKRARELCTTKSYSDGDALLGKLISLCREKRDTGGGVDLHEIYNLPSLPDLIAHPNYHDDIKRLQEMSLDNISLVQGTLSNGITISRSEICNNIKSALTDKKIVSVTGQSGIGKSAIVKTVYSEKSCHFKLWFANKDFDIQRLNHPLVSIIDNLPTADVLIVIDSVERLATQHRAMLAQLISIAKRRGFCVILTTTDPLPLKIESVPIEVPPLTDDDLSEVFDKDRSLYSLWHSKGMNTLMCIPKILDWCIELLASSPGATLDPVNFADHLWDKWIQSRADDKYLRSQILKEIAAFDGDGFKSGVYISQISNVSILAPLEKDNLVYTRNELIFWKHDLIGDWARERILVENKDDFLNFVKDKYHRPKWKHSILLFGQWLLNTPGGVDKWVSYVNSQKDELQFLLLDSVIFANKSFELCESIKNVLLDKECELLNLLLNRLFLVGNSKTVINGQTLLILNLRLALPFLYFINKYFEDIIPYCHHNISRICIYFLFFCRGTQYSSVAAKLAVEVAKFAYKNEKHIQADKNHGSHLYLKNDALDEIWMSFLFAFQDSPETVMKYSLVFAEIEDPEDEELKSLSSSDKGVATIPQHKFLVKQRYIPAWPGGPQRKISERFRNVCLNGNILNPFFTKYPDDAARLLKAVCIEAPHYSYEFPSTLESSYGLDALDQTDHACCYFIGPWLQLLEQHSKIALKIIIDLVNFATERFVAAERQKEQQRASLKSSIPLVESLMESGPWGTPLLEGNSEKQIVWFGDERVFGWYRNRLINSPIIPTILMALEKWLYDLVDENKTIDHYLDYILNNNKSVAIAGVLCSVIKKHPILLYGKLKILASAWQFLTWDMKISLEKSWEIGFGFYYQKLGEKLYNKALEWNQMPHRRLLFRNAVLTCLQWAIIYDLDIAYFDAVANFWRRQHGKQRPNQWLIEQLTTSNYKIIRLPDNKVEVRFSYPRSLDQKLSDDAIVQSANMSAMTFPFECRQAIENDGATSDIEAENIWNRMNQLADSLLKKTNAESDSGADVFVTYREIYCAGICAILHQNPDFIMHHEDRRRWTIQTVFQIYNDQPSRWELDTPAMHLLNSWDSCIGEISLLLYRHRVGDEYNTKELLARSLLLFHYAAIKASLSSARSELADEHILLELINLHIKYSFARGLLWLDGTWRDYMLHDFKTIGNQMICDYYNDFCANNKYARQIIDIGKLHAKYLKIRDHELQFDTLRMSQSSNILVRLYAKVKLKISSMLNRAARKFDRHEIKDFKNIYESRFLRQQICDFNQLSLVLSIVDFSNTNNFSYKNQLDLLLQIETLMLMPLRRNQDAGDHFCSDANAYPNKCESSCLHKIADSLTLIDPEHARTLWRPILALDQYFHSWIDVFLSWFFCSGSKTNLAQFAIIWKEMIVFANEHWDVKSYDAQNLQLRLLGIYNRDFFWTDVNFIPVINDLTPLFLKWASNFIKKHDNVNNYIAFCASNAGAPLLKDSLLIIADALESTHLRDTETTASLSAQLCKEIWKNHMNLITENQNLNDAFFRILSKAISLGNEDAIDLQNEIYMSSTQPM